MPVSYTHLDVYKRQESRHLGLVMPEEIPGLREKLEFVKEKIRAGIDLDGILEAAEKAPELLIKIPGIIKKQEGKTISGAAAVHTVCHAVFDGSRAIFQGKRELAVSYTHLWILKICSTL